MYQKNATESRVLGDGTEADSWIWSYGNLRGLDDAEKAQFLLEVEKVHWFRAQADMMRWVEEVELLEEDLRRVSRSAKRMHDFWSSAAKTIADVTSGKRVYAEDKASMYMRMEVDARNALARAGGGWPEEGESVVEYAARRRPCLDVEWVPADEKP
ncbi:hypothetical protein NMY22_g18461 [Coprinellus aureogranulatus]|nr:hypothetical protein NMY22_g18461 [Coprinellus aureogranulatus]